MAKKATARALDMTNVEEGGKFNKKHQTPGDYKAKIMGVEDAKPKDESDSTPMWLFSIKVGSGTYPYYCKLQPNQLWKVRNLCTAAGIAIPRKKIKVDPNKLVGRLIAVTLDDTEYKDKLQSEISATFPVSELEEDDVELAEDEEVEDEELEDEEDEEEEDEEEDDEEEEDEEDEEEEEPEPPRKKKKATKKKARKPVDDDDEDLDELDIDDV